MVNCPQIDVLELALALSSAIDLVSPIVTRHQIRVAQLALELLQRMGAPPSEAEDVLLAGLLHDCGALSLQERVDLLRFEQSDAGVHVHGDRGWRLLRLYPPFRGAADVVRWHHLPWRAQTQTSEMHGPVPRGAHVIHLADRVDVLLRSSTHPLADVDAIVGTLRSLSGDVFMPDAVDAFVEAATSEAFWLSTVADGPEAIRARGRRLGAGLTEATDLRGVSKLFAELVDFRSRFTATHSSGVAATAARLARAANFSDAEVKTMYVAGHLHDIGKLAVPQSILEKPGRLTAAEFAVVRSHTYHGWRILDPIPALERPKVWGTLHHEKMDGTGYPFRLPGTELELGSRIMAVSDVFTALTEERPYRDGMGLGKALDIVADMADRGSLDPVVAGWLRRDADELDATRAAAQAENRRATTELGLFV